MAPYKQTDMWRHRDTGRIPREDEGRDWGYTGNANDYNPASGS